ncbi:cyclase family protein [Methanolobus chelungpuianus]|uniref:Cyclase n=1 Tax=Methanolobus chelungpuianus TaxID=502115 RepID=A0AAE3KVY9_9EURY|nr:cyclase family protein [Methanolobus chelungpuianus]MCQ6962135.1 hypothetical protein [Methanolobus chelungpuianus]
MHGRILDITVGISRDTPVFPGDPETRIEAVSSIPSEGYAVSRVTFGTHTGTHVDSPAHIFENGLSIDRVPLSSMIGKALVLDLSDGTADISQRELKAAFMNSCAENTTGVDILLLKTRRVSNGMCQSTNGHDTGIRGLMPDAGIWVAEQGFKLIGTDTLSVDAGTSLDNHRLFLENNVVILENIDVSEVSEGSYHFICLPLKLEGCDAAPARVVLIEGGFF